MAGTRWSPSVTALLLLLNTLSTVQAIQTISTVGSKFFREDGSQYYIKGIAYQLIPEDPLIDTAQCTRDAARMAELGTNAIRVYHVDPQADHDGCMKAFADAGIYLFVDLDTFDTAITQDAPRWDQSQLDSFKAVLDEFQQYDNTAGFFVGNEILTTNQGSGAAPYILAAVRDLKSYRNEKNYRNIPIGYSAADIAELRPMLQNYLVCRPDSAERLDFFALNAYEWCGDSSYEQSGYKSLQEQAKGFPIPIFFSETGCNVARPRTFSDQAAIFGDEMSDTWSGSMIYEWIEETNDYGLINYGPHVDNAPATNTLVQDGFTRQGEPTPIAPDFDNLKAQWATLNPTGVALSDYAASTSAISVPDCPAPTADGWSVDPSAPLPTLGETFHPASSSSSSTASSSTTTGTDTTTKTSGVSDSDVSGSSGTTGGSSNSATTTQPGDGGSPSSPSASPTYELSNGAGSLSVTTSASRLVDVSILISMVIGGLAVWL
ncbi:hypothetical protein BO71DRAFT_133683 [Aspergillus ellipticus CBS 707.79]|uniref:1,3-beta-glucanosyltransferase n=1 Tax=Aspergillus ellipticus CBS 707.79 TaxID=1448320 RepID=A0A319EZ96_9EURO|nr:hypothetical protein BO71DRAFT_133683 [Aspergillus ellipticus CBS 707.79]